MTLTEFNHDRPLFKIENTKKNQIQIHLQVTFMFYLITCFHFVFLYRNSVSAVGCYCPKMQNFDQCGKKIIRLANVFGDKRNCNSHASTLELFPLDKVVHMIIYIMGGGG